MSSAHPRLKTFVAAAALVLSAVVLAPERAAAQTNPPCISCPPGEDPPGGPPEVAFSPADASYAGAAAGRPQRVEVTFCAYAGLQASTRRILFNGDEVTALFALDAQGGTGDPTCTQRYVYAATLTLGPGANSLFASIENGDGTGKGSTVLSYRVTGYGVAVTPDRSDVVLPMGTTATQSFTVTNTGSATATFALSTTCGEAVSTCPASAAQLTLAAGASAPVTVTYTPRLAGAAGLLRLRAARVGAAAAYDEGSLAVTVPATAGGQGAPSVAAAEGGHGTAPTPGLCLAMPAGPGADYQCGDLRLAHALPTVRTVGKARTPVLVYNSAHAAPFPLAAARVQLPSTSASPTSVRATLTLAGGPSPIVVRDYAGGEWTPGRWRRVTLGKLATDLGTGLHDYTLAVSFFHGSTELKSSIPGTFGVVDRAAGPFGAGWWLAGLERITPSTGVIAWTGGDGAQRRYTRMSDSVWVAPVVSHGDTLRQRGSEYVRILPGGDSVVFDADGRHVATADRLGRRTVFVYDELGRLASIRVPTGRGAARVRESHRFVYAGGRLTEVQSYDSLGSWAAPRKTRIEHGLGDGRITAITDPDGRTVRFGYGDAVATRITSRTDRRGNPTTWTYDTAGKLAEAAISLGAGEAPARTRWRPAESSGIARSSPYRATTWVDGPRVDVPDVVSFGLSYFGAPAEITDADGRVTRIVHHAAFPALPAQVTSPGGQKTVATYDALGRLTAVVDSSTWRLRPDGSREWATTRYAYGDVRFPRQPTRIVPPEQDSTVVAYNALGLREWMQDARGDSTRVAFGYDPATGQVSSVRSWKSGQLDSLRYDPRGNLEWTRGALGEVTLIRADSLGRVVRAVSPVFENTLTAGDSAYSLTWYDRMDRVRRTESVGPAMKLPRLAADTARLFPQATSTDRERVFVETFHDAEGQPDSVARWVAPDSAGLGRMVTRWRYDAAGRAVREVAADHAVEHRALDEAGNAVGTVTRRGHVLSMQYDAMNRLVRRIIPEVSYPRITVPAMDSTWIFPLFEPVEPGAFGGARNTGGLTLPADTAVFAYDSAGRMVRADNRDAKVSRVWNPNGTLRSETQRIRTYRGSDFDAHAYTIAYEYDLNGRRVKVIHPPGLAPAGGRGFADYAYHPHGALKAVNDVLGKGAAYDWDAEGQLAARQGMTRLELAYDRGGRMVRRLESVNPELFLHNDTLVYDLRGKVLAAQARIERLSTVSRYSGLGALVYSQTRNLGDDTRSVEEYRMDPLANYVARASSSSALQTILPPAQEAERYAYEAGTGRLLQRTSQAQSQSTYDASGNQTATASVRPITTPYDTDQGESSLFTRTHAYFGADERLRVLDRRACLVMRAGLGCAYRGEVPPVSERGAFEEHRYDALGRRVLVRTRQEHACHDSAGGVLADCIRSVVRTVWDGDQVLYEVSAPGGSTAPAAEMERDTGHHVAMANDRNYYGYGRVAYAHGLGIDDPVTVVRMEYSDAIPWAVSIQPLANWAGRYDGGVGIECMEYRGAESIRLMEETWPPGEVRERNLWDDGDYVRHCTDSDWPAQGAWLSLHRKPTQFHPRRAWMGSLIAHGQDASGQYYRRNRYYDASTGRFTQEDPIGLAGGINLYGYANGDPVSYHDPHGLCPQEQQDKHGRCPGGLSVRQWQAIERAMANQRDEVAKARILKLLNDGKIHAKEMGRRPGITSWSRGSFTLNSEPGDNVFEWNSDDLAYLLFHEDRHVQQVERADQYGISREEMAWHLQAAYVGQWLIHGYRGINMERDAREYACATVTRLGPYAAYACRK